MLRHENSKMDFSSDILSNFSIPEFPISANLGFPGGVSSLSTVGYGTPIMTSAYFRSKPTCSCSKAKCGRTYHRHNSDNLCLFPKTARGPKKWKNIYRCHTSIVRSNNREKVDYKLEFGRHRSTMMWHMCIYGAMICQHMDACYFSQKEAWDTFKSVFINMTRFRRFYKCQYCTIYFRFVAYF